MSTDTVIAPNVAGAVETVESHLHPKPSFDLADHPMPTGKEEIWRFTPIRRIKKLLNQVDIKTELDWELKDIGPAVLKQLKPEEAIKLGIVPPSDRLSAIALSNSKNTKLLEYPDGTEFSQTAVIAINGTGITEPIFQHSIIKIGKHCKFTLLVEYHGSAVLGENVNILIGEGSQINILFVQNWNKDAVHGAQIACRVGRDADLKISQATLGGDTVRIYQTAAFDEPGGRLEQLGLYFVQAGKHIEHRMFVDHNQPKTYSNVDYRGCLHGHKARSVWIGDVLIRKVAQGIETYEANKNLVLTDGCQADSVPNLEIQTGDIIGAGHSSTTGRFDDEQLFYLKSRGIPEAQARRLVVHGFFADIVRRINVPTVEKTLLSAIEKELDQAAAEHE